MSAAPERHHAPDGETFVEVPQRTDSTPTDTTSRTEHVQGEAGKQAEPAQGKAESQQAAPRSSKGGLTPEQRARGTAASVLSRARKKAEREEASRTAHLTTRQKLGLALANVSQADMQAIIDQLVADAKSGDQKSVAALARLLDQSFGRSGTEPAADPRPAEERAWSELTEAERAEYRASALANYRAQRIAAGLPDDPRLAITTPSLDVHEHDVVDGSDGRT